MGTPEFAVPSLEILWKSGFNIVGVITAPDKPAGRGLQLQQSAVKKFAIEKGLNVLQPEKLKNENFIAELKSLRPDLAVVVAFRKLPEVVWQLPPLGTFNLHASLLPQYRGAAPINWAIMNGEKETGATTFFINQEIDTGKILFQEKINIRDDETAGELHDELKTLGAALVLKTVQSIDEKTFTEHDQLLTPSFKTAPKLFTTNCKINWEKSADEIYNLIRGLSPYPAAFTLLQGKNLKIFRSKKIIEAHQKKSGDIFSDGKTFLRFACVDGWIDVNELQLEGKKKMVTEEFLRGNKIEL